jgi:hypothetical protein
MRRSSWLSVGILLLSLVGCEKYVVSLKPLGTDESSVSVPGFEGKWASEGQVWTVRPKESSVYEVRVSDVGSVARFDVRAQRLGAHLFLDMMPVKESGDEEVPSLYAAHWLLASSFMKMQLTGDALNLDRMNADGLKEALQEKPGLIKHVFQGDNVVLVEETEALVQFVQAQVDVNELWQSHGEFVRCAPLYSPQDLIKLDGFVGRWLDPNEPDQGHFEVQLEGDHYGIQLNSKSDDRLTMSVHLFKLQHWTLMGVFMGSQDSRAQEMATCMPDWFGVVALEDDQLHLSVLDTTKVQALLTHPEKAQEVMADSEAETILVRP